MGLDAGGGLFEADLDGNGVVSEVDSDIPAGAFSDGGNAVTAKLELQDTSSGSVDVPNADMHFGLKAKIKFTYAAGAPCSTTEFDIDFSTSNWSSSGAGACTTGYDETTGEFCMTGANFTVPTLAAGACQSHGNAINSLFNLGSSSNTYMQILLGQTVDIITR